MTIKFLINKRSLSIFIISLFLEGCTPIFHLTSSDSKFIGGANKNEKVIVFVHGVGGDNGSTWRNSKTNKYFPELITSDPDLKKEFDVFVASYYKSDKEIDSNIFGLAKNLNDLLEEKGIFPKLNGENNPKVSYNKVYFVAHSMGNLVLRTALIQRPDPDPKQQEIPLIVSFASPSDGSNAAEVAKLIANSPQLDDMVTVEKNSFLSLLNLVWKARARDTEIACAYEKKPLIGKALVVPQKSATAICSRMDFKGIDLDHMTIVKPNDSHSEPFTWLKAQLTKPSNKKGWELKRWTDNKIIIAGKDYPESNIHMAMIALVIEDQLPSIKVERKYDAGDGAHIYHELQSENIDIYPEYSGSMLFAYMGEEPESFNKGKNEDAIKNDNKIEELNKKITNRGLKMEFYPQFGFNSPFVLVMLKSQAEKMHLLKDGKIKLSDLAKQSSQCVIGADPGFFPRNDGYAGLQRAYAKEKLDFGNKYYFKHDDSFDALTTWGKKNECLVILSYGTDPELFDSNFNDKYIKISDDKGFFPIHNPAPLAHSFLEKKFKGIKNALAKLENIISEKEMACLNKKGNTFWEEKNKDKRNSLIENLARDFLIEKGVLPKIHATVKSVCNKNLNTL